MSSNAHLSYSPVCVCVCVFFLWYGQCVRLTVPCRITAVEAVVAEEEEAAAAVVEEVAVEVAAAVEVVAVEEEEVAAVVEVEVAVHGPRK